MSVSIKTIKIRSFLKKGLDKMKKWRAFASMLEQYLGLQEFINKQIEVPQPLLTEGKKLPQGDFFFIQWCFYSS
jgi:hypothetical protein